MMWEFGTGIALYIIAQPMILILIIVLIVVLSILATLLTVNVDDIAAQQYYNFNGDDKYL